MTPADDRRDRPFADLVAAYADALRTGDPSPMTPPAELPADLRADLENARAVVRLLQAGLGPAAPPGSHDAPTVLLGPDLARLTAAAGEPPDESALPQIGRFRLLRELGRGGFGIVFLALDPVLRREVALKVPRPEALLTAELRQRFVREAQAAGSLDHPHVVPVYEAGEAGPVCYIASAYCPGANLAEHLSGREGPLERRAAAGLVAALADAVQHAHDRNILHRDLKPANVILAPCEGALPGWLPLSPQASSGLPSAENCCTRPGAPSVV
jgi:hypothetical protein